MLEYIKGFFIISEAVKMQHQFKVFNIRGAYDKFPVFFHVGPFIDSKHMKI